MVAPVPTKLNPVEQAEAAVAEEQDEAPVPHEVQVPAAEFKKNPALHPVATVALVHAEAPAPQATQTPF